MTLIRKRRFPLRRRPDSTPPVTDVQPSTIKSKEISASFFGITVAEHARIKVARACFTTSAVAAAASRTSRDGHGQGASANKTPFNKRDNTFKNPLSWAPWQQDRPGGRRSHHGRKPSTILVAVGWKPFRWHRRPF